MSSYSRLLNFLGQLNDNKDIELDIVDEPRTIRQQLHINDNELKETAKDLNENTYARMIELLIEYPNIMDHYFNKRLELEKDIKISEKEDIDPPGPPNFVLVEVPLSISSKDFNRPSSSWGKGARGIGEWKSELDLRKIRDQIRICKEEILTLTNRLNELEDWNDR